MREFNGIVPAFETAEDFLKSMLYNNDPINMLDGPNDTNQTTWTMFSILPQQLRLNIPVMAACCLCAGHLMAFCDSNSSGDSGQESYL